MSKYRTDFNNRNWLSPPRLTPFAIGPHHDPYMLRWRLFPVNRWGNLYLHWFRHDDEDRALHDHPWKSMSIMLWGETTEVWLDRGFFKSTGGREQRRKTPLFWPVFREATFAHRLIIHKRALTLFFTGPRVRDWGFLCPKGWRPWQEFVNMKNPGEAGPGCD